MMLMMMMRRMMMIIMMMMMRIMKMMMMMMMLMMMTIKLLITFGEMWRAICCFKRSPVCVLSVVVAVACSSSHLRAQM